jgi:hypothetical protein
MEVTETISGIHCTTSVWLIGLVTWVFAIVSRMKSSVFWDITPCSPLKVNRRFGWTHRLHLHGRRIGRATNQRESRWQAEAICSSETSVHSQRTARRYIPQDSITAVRTSTPTNRRMIDELKRIWKEAIVAYSRYYPGICLEGLRKTIKNLSQYSQRPCSRDSNRVPPEYKTITATLTRSVPLRNCCLKEQVNRYVGYQSHTVIQRIWKETIVA